MNTRFFSLKPKIAKPNFESACSDKPQFALSGTSHTISTPFEKLYIENSKVDHFFDITQEPNNIGAGLHGPDPRFLKTPKPSNFPESDSDFGKAIPTPVDTTLKSGGISNSRQTNERAGIRKRAAKTYGNRQITGGFTHTNGPPTKQYRPVNSRNGKYDRRGNRTCH